MVNFLAEIVLVCVLIFLGTILIDMIAGEISVFKSDEKA